jgi:hypothetical protein
MQFHPEQGGAMIEYGAISPDIVKSLGISGLQMGRGFQFAE